MRKLTYELSNGTIVNTMKEAKNSGLPYKVVMQNIKEKKGRMSAKREALIKEHGFVPIV